MIQILFQLLSWAWLQVFLFVYLCLIEVRCRVSLSSVIIKLGCCEWPRGTWPRPYLEMHYEEYGFTTAEHRKLWLRPIFQVITQPIEVIKSASDWNYKVFRQANFYSSILATYSERPKYLPNIEKFPASFRSVLAILSLSIFISNRWVAWHFSDTLSYFTLAEPFVPVHGARVNEKLAAC